MAYWSFTLHLFVLMWCNQIVLTFFGWAEESDFCLYTHKAMQIKHSAVHTYAQGIGSECSGLWGLVMEDSMCPGITHMDPPLRGRWDLKGDREMEALRGRAADAQRSVRRLMERQQKSSELCRARCSQRSTGTQTHWQERKVMQWRMFQGWSLSKTFHRKLFGKLE